MSKTIKFGLVLLAIVGLISGYMAYRIIYKNNTIGQEKKDIYIGSHQTFEDVLQTLKDSNVLVNYSAFEMLASYMDYKNNIKPGKYILSPGMSNKAIISKLRSGNQDPQNVTINNVRMMSDLAGKAARYFEADSLAFLDYLRNPDNAATYGLNAENFMTMFIPNTYQMFWTTTPEKFVKRMKKEFDNFWTEEKLSKLRRHNLNPVSAYILASIVERESQYDPERPDIAAVYLNRLKTGQRLQADPTVVYATGDFSLQRVLHKHLTIDSPYNTYLYSGLPPGPICMPSMSSLNAVINAPEHDYMFFCAKPDNSGTHTFAVTYQEHLQNAKAFSNWLNSLQIK